MFRGVAGVAFGAAMAIANISPAAASPTATTMREGGFALAPLSFVKFCLDYPSDCPKTAGPARIHLTSAHMAELASVNRAVNAAIRPTPDTSAMRFWRLNVSAGDCNEFAIEKRHELIRRGWPAAALALTVAKTSWGEGHLVVTVRTDQGDLVLDNLRSTIIAWQKTGYDWIMRQSEADPQLWVELDGGEEGTMTAGAEFGEATEVAEADLTSPVVSDATPARRHVVANRAVAGDAAMKRAAPARLAPVQIAKLEPPTPPVHQAARAVAAVAMSLEQAAARRSPDVATLEADVANTALEQASRLATTTVDLGFAAANAPRSPDVAALEADVASPAPQASRPAQVPVLAIAALPRWIADASQNARSFANNLAAELNDWFAASATASSPSAPQEAREAATGDIGLRGFL